MKKIRFIALLLVLLSLLLVIPTTFALNNDTIVSSDANAPILGEDYYFDANLPNDDGNGSIDNPYRDLTSSRIMDNSVIHLADGEYNLDYSKTVRNVTILGQNADNTVMKGDGNRFTVSTSLMISNVTFLNLKITNNGNLTASDAIFMDSANTNGGVIYSVSDNSNVYLNNSTFIGNTATDGGAIYMKNGVLSIENSKFISNNASGLGGAIYLFKSSLNASNMFIINSNANFGAGIMALESKLNMTYITARENRAKYNGGAIYTIYGSSNITQSVFQSNYASNGAGIFTNMLVEFHCYNNTFSENSANFTGGAAYDIDCFDLIFENNTFINNHAANESDFYCLDVFNIFLSNSNYTMLKYSYIYDGDLPNRYDLRELGQVTPVKNQGSGGNCWSFATIAALDTAILKATGISYDLSEDNMKNLMAGYSEYGWKMETNVGGYLKMGIGYFASWLGPVNESDDPYDGKSLVSPVFNSLFHIQNIIFPERTSYTDNDAVKRAIMNYGAVATGIYSAGTTYQYYTGDHGNNHAIAIVGWDDDLEFSGAPAKGGWIAKNSWGPNAYDNGYFYISYYDVSCLKPGKTGDYFAIILNDTIRYDKNYQHEIQGYTDFFYNTTDTVWYKNKFTSTGDEYLAAVSTYFIKKTNWELSVYLNDELKLTQSGFSLPGYYTIDLNSLIQLHKDDEFAVEFKIKVDGDIGVPISEYVSLNVETYGENMSFISYDGVNWVDFYGLEGTYPDHTYISQVACIKAFTILNPIVSHINLTVVDKINPAVVEAVVYNEYGKIINSGEVIFITDGHGYRVKIENGVARFSYAYSTFGEKLVQAIFEATGYVTSERYVIVPVEAKGDLVIYTNITVDYTDVLINVSLSKPLNEKIYVAVNDELWEVYTNEGVGILNLTHGYYGNYSVYAYSLSTDYNCINSTNSFEICYYNTFIGYFSTEAYYADNCTFYVKLIDQKGNPIAGKSIIFRIASYTATGVTDEDGRTFILFKNVLGTYEINMAFLGDDKYMPTSGSVLFTIKSTITLPQHTKYAYNSNYEVSLVDSNGNALSNITVTVGPNGEKAVTDENGKLSLNINFTPNTYTMSVINPQNGEVKTQNIEVVKKITENANVVMYYGAGKSYSVRVCDDYGEFTSGVMVKITINGKTYTRYTNANGYASLKISLKPGTYAVTAVSNGYKVSNKVTVKTTIITKDITVKKGKNIKFNAKLLNSNGKILKNKKVTFKFKGKTYKVKTSSKGIATLNIKNPYNVGTYKIYTSYGGLTVKNCIKIKK